MVHTLVAEKEERVDKYLSLHTDISREKINKLITEEKILVNDKIVKPAFKLKIGDKITYPEIAIDNSLEKENIPLDIIYEDNDVLVINKPSGLVVHPANGNEHHTLVNALLNYTSSLSNIDPLRPGIVHRLDKDTSGLMLVAKTNTAHQILVEDFKNKRVKREYIALITGVFPKMKAYIDAPIARDKKNFQKYTVASGGKAARTHLEVIKKYQNYTLVRLKLETGRTHQIRVHLAYIGYPIYNDPVYTNKKCTDFGQFLHSATLEFIHPTTGEKLCFSADLPPEFQNFLKQIEENEKEDKIS